MSSLTQGQFRVYLHKYLSPDDDPDHAWVYLPFGLFKRQIYLIRTMHSLQERIKQISLGLLRIFLQALAAYVSSCIYALCWTNFQREILKRVRTDDLMLGALQQSEPVAILDTPAKKRIAQLAQFSEEIRVSGYREDGVPAFSVELKVASDLMVPGLA